MGGVSGTNASSLDRGAQGGVTIQSARPSFERSRAGNRNCPLEIGHDPRRESIGGEAAPAHLRGLPPMRMLPEVGASRGSLSMLRKGAFTSALLCNTGFSNLTGRVREAQGLPKIFPSFRTA